MAEVVIILGCVGGVVGAFGGSFGAFYCIFRKPRRQDVSRPLPVKYKLNEKIEKSVKEKELKRRMFGFGIFRKRRGVTMHEKKVIGPDGVVRVVGVEYKLSEEEVFMEEEGSIQGEEGEGEDEGEATMLSRVFGCGLRRKKAVSLSEEIYEEKGEPLDRMGSTKRRGGLTIKSALITRLPSQKDGPAVPVNKEPRKKRHHKNIQKEEVVEDEVPDEVPDEVYDYKEELQRIDVEEANFTSIALIDYDMHRKGRIISASRVESRRAQRRTEREAGKLDAVTANSGPTPDLLPKGWSADPVAPTALDKKLIKRRLMVYWNVPREGVGWFVGTVVNQCDRDGANYLIKYDRQETGNLFVDGIKPTKLSFMGHEAYGVSWILVIPTPAPETVADEFGNEVVITTAGASLPKTPYSPMPGPGSPAGQAGTSRDAGLSLSSPGSLLKSRTMNSLFASPGAKIEPFESPTRTVRTSPNKGRQSHGGEPLEVEELCDINRPHTGIPLSVTLPFIQNSEANF